MIHRQTAAGFYTEFVNNCDLSSEYKTALVKAINSILDPSILFNSFMYRDISDKVVVAQSKLRGARGKATFDDLCRLNYVVLENSVLNYYRAMLFMTVSDNRCVCCKI